MSRFLDRLIIDGEKLDLRVESNVVDGRHLRTMEGASTVELTIHDPDRELLTNGVLTKRRKAKKSGSVFPSSSQLRLGKTLCYLDGDPYRLAGVTKQGSNLELQFEHEIVAILRSRHKPRVNSRRYSTRAQFIRRSLLYTENGRMIAAYMPSLKQRQPTKKPEDPDPIGVPKTGLGAKADQVVQINGSPINPDQRRNLDVVLKVLDDLNVGERASIAIIAGAIGESSFSTKAENDRSHAKGVFQILPSWEASGLISHREVELGAKVFLNVGFTHMSGTRAGLLDQIKRPGPGGAIRLAQDNQNMSPGTIAMLVEGSGVDVYTDQIPDAQAILEAGGGEPGRTVTITEDFLYYVGNFDSDSAFGEQKENYWEGAQRLAAEVRWPLFVSNNMVWFAKDRDLFKNAPVAMVAEQPNRRLTQVGVQYVGNIDFTQHYNRPVEEIRFTAHADQFFAFPGACIHILGLGIADGKYLIEEISDDMTSSDVDIVCRRPISQLAEPAASVTTISLPDSETVPQRVGTGDLVYPLPIQGKFLGGPGAGTHTGIWQDRNAVDIGVPIGTPVVAVEDGTLIRLGGHWNGGADRYDGFKQTLVGSSNTWFYQHLSSRASGLHEGITIKAGQRIGVSGAGNGVPHLHIACEHGSPELLLGIGPDWTAASERRRQRQRIPNNPRSGGGSTDNPRGAGG